MIFGQAATLYPKISRSGDHAGEEFTRSRDDKAQLLKPREGLENWPAVSLTENRDHLCKAGLLSVKSRSAVLVKKIHQA
ncbi:MAG: hypothetical protein CL609_09510 [Anaerolineaceae bacterium]|nr:hypothetical protein [Anaerolineaceae bacterium]